MQDFVPLGTGNSRSLKSAVPAGSTWEQALKMLRSGTFPIDIGAVNDAGVAQKGTPLNRETLLSGETELLYPGLPENPVPDDVLKRIPELLQNYSKVEFGTYLGNGATSIQITVGIDPELLIAYFNGSGGSWRADMNGFGIIPCGSRMFKSPTDSVYKGCMVFYDDKVYQNDFIVRKPTKKGGIHWQYFGSSVSNPSALALNAKDVAYEYICFGR